MAEYLIQEETLIEVADLLREKFIDLDAASILVGGDRNDLTNILIPENTTTLGTYALSDCKNLVEVIIPDSVTTIMFDALQNCTNLIDVTIGSGIIQISSQAFQGSKNIKNIYLRATTPPIITLASFPESIETFHVPIGSEETYKSATNWSTFADRIVGDVVLENMG